MQQTKDIYMTLPDLQSLQDLFSRYKHKDQFDLKMTSDLKSEIRRAKVIDPNHVPSNIVTLNSNIEIEDIDTGDRITFSIVLPEYANLDENKFSILTPIGISVIGYQLGDEIIWEVPKGKKRFRIIKIVYQPESDGQSI